MRKEARSKLSRVITRQSLALACPPESEWTGPVKPQTLHDIRHTNFASPATYLFPYLLVLSELHFGHRIDLFLGHSMYQQKVINAGIIR